jgi:hypothetical protein
LFSHVDGVSPTPFPRQIGFQLRSCEEHRSTDVKAWKPTWGFWAGLKEPQGRGGAAMGFKDIPTSEVTKLKSVSRKHVVETIFPDYIWSTDPQGCLMSMVVNIQFKCF